MRPAARNTRRAHRRDDGDDADQERDPHRIAAGAAGEQHGRGDRAGARHQRNGERKRRDIAHLLFQRLVGSFRLTRDAQAEDHLGGDREQQQSAGDAEGR